MAKKLSINSNVRYNELKEYKTRFEKNQVNEIAFQLYLDGIPFSAILKYGLTQTRMRYDRRYKCKIYFDGITNKVNQKKVIEKLYEVNPSDPILLMEILFAKERQEIIPHEDGRLEYHFTFLQY